MSSVELGLDLVLTFLLAAGLLFHYGNWYRHHVLVTFAVLIAWYFSLIIVTVIPLDVSNVRHRPWKAGLKSGGEYLGRPINVKGWSKTEGARV
jgi:hypothetical protein